MFDDDPDGLAFDEGAGRLVEEEWLAEEARKKAEYQARRLARELHPSSGGYVEVPVRRSDLLVAAGLALAAVGGLFLVAWLFQRFALFAVAGVWLSVFVGVSAR